MIGYIVGNVSTDSDDRGGTSSTEETAGLILLQMISTLLLIERYLIMSAEV